MPRVGLLRGSNNEALQVPRTGPNASGRGTAPPPPGRLLLDPGAVHAGFPSGTAVAGGPGASSGQRRSHCVRPLRPPLAARPPARPSSRPAPPAALTAFFFCTILSIFLAMRTTSSSMAPAGLPRAQPVLDGKRGKLGQRPRPDVSSIARRAQGGRPRPRPFLTNPAAAAAAVAAAAATPPPQAAPIKLRALGAGATNQQRIAGSGRAWALSGGNGRAQPQCFPPGSRESLQAAGSTLGARSPPARLYRVQLHPERGLPGQPGGWNLQRPTGLRTEVGLQNGTLAVFKAFSPW